MRLIRVVCTDSMWLVIGEMIAFRVQAMENGGLLISWEMW